MAAVVCICKRTIADGDRRITLAAQIDWGKHDLREPWEGTATFCCFRCAADWAAEKAEQHDERFVVEGVEGTP